MTSIVDDCAHQCLLPDGQSALYDSIPPFDEELAQDVTVEELSLPPPAETVDDNQVASGSSLPATPAERPCTFCPSSLPLPPATCTTRATLVLDLDGTLIASEELNACNSAYLWNTPAGARAPDYEAMGRRVWLRPGVREFLAAVRPHFEIILFTAATQNWAAAAIEQLDPAAELFDVMLHRDHTTSDLSWDYVKDLSRLGRDLARVVIVDDNPLMFMYQPDNALHIGAYEAATAGGPDNALPRVAEVLINQVAPSSDVRDVLGPMASAKSCITSTATAAQGAINPPAQLAEASADGAVAMESTLLSEVDEHLMADSHNAGSCSAAEGQCDAVMADERWDTAVGDADGGEPGDAEQDVPVKRAVEEHQPQDLLESQSGGRCRKGLGHEGELQCSLTNDTEKDAEWDGESEGPETFDEHGTAAQLGSDVVGSCHRHRTWGDDGRGGNDGSIMDTAAATAAVSQESGEQEESDACPSEEPSVHSSEDFEALMDDAMAEYDSDAYEGSYDNGTGFECPCPADTAAPATALQVVSLAGQPAGCSTFSSGSGCCDYAGDCSIRPCANQAPSDDGNVTGRFTQLEHVTGVEAQLASAGAQTFVGQHGLDAAGRPESAVAGETDQPSAGAFTSLTGPMLSGAEVSGPAAALAQPHHEDVHGQCRQPTLPSGMVFLTDLNPAFASAAGALEASQATVGDCDGGAALATGDAVREVLGSKRLRSDAELTCDGADVEREVVARVSCERTPHSRRLRLTDGGMEELAAGSGSHSCAGAEASVAHASC